MFGRFSPIWLLFIACTAGLLSCSSMPLHEAQGIVSQADSLWQAGQPYGVDEGDSATIAQAYQALDKYSLFYPFVHCTSSLGTSYAHACYHYGRLLRRKDNPVAAMQAFIHATHSSTRDYHILGRVYSNMGSICHLAGDFQLSHDMYERSAHYFHKNSDTIPYYYALNDMAFELAEQGAKRETIELLETIEKACMDEEVLVKVLETRARLYMKCRQYDSALYYAYRVFNKDTNNLTVSLIIAQSYSYSGKKDSATAYANKVLSKPHELFETSNALYILTNDDETRDKHLIRAAAAARADTQKLIEIRQGKLSQAVQLLELDIHRKPDWKWLYAVITTLVVIGTFAMIYIHRKRTKHQLLSQQVNDLTQDSTTAKQRHELIVREHENYINSIVNDIEEKCEAIIQNKAFPQNLSWKDFPLMCRVIDENLYMFVSKLYHRHTLNETEIRLCVLVFLHLDRNRIADVLPYAKNGVGKLKYRVAKKLGIDSQNLRKYLISMIINESFKGS